MAHDIDTSGLIHLFYKGSYMELKPYFSNLYNNGTRLFFNIVNDGMPSRQIFDDIMNDFPSSVILNATNKGKDIGGKLALIDYLLKTGQNSKYCILLHDKHSPHTSFGKSWRQKLFKIAEVKNIGRIKKLFNQKKEVGIVASKEFIINDYLSQKREFKNSNSELLKQLMLTYNISTKDLQYVGGTMFWIKTEILRSFFSEKDPLSIFQKLEYGNVLDTNEGTLTHSWERMFSWIAISQGYKIKGI